MDENLNAIYMKNRALVIERTEHDL